MTFNTNYKIFRLSLLVIIALELLSLLGYFYSSINFAFFILIIFALLLISLWRLEWGVLILLIELFISSKGYLFYIEIDGISISIRIAMWLIIMAVWLAAFIIDVIKTKKFDLSIFKNKIVILFSLLFFFIAFAIVNGIINKNAFNNIFFDMNGWLYFSLIFPLYRVFNSDFFIKLSSVFLSSVIWLSAKTLLLLYLFSHQLPGITYEIYRWVRESGVGEITQLQGGFYRIFFQSHLFVFIAFFIAMLMLTEKIKAGSHYKEILSKIIILSLFFSVILISFSRSNWVGLTVGCLVFLYFTFSFFKLKFKELILLLTTTLTIALLGFGIIVMTVKIPFPNPIGGFSTSDLFKERASQISGEAAVTSRWKLLPVLMSNVKKSPILGYGFGKTVTYETEDPRAKEQNIKGEYTTYAFEWGWIDIWLKFGLLGLVTYIALILSLVFGALKYKNLINIAVIIGLVVVSAIHFLSPYLNHPLGIGFLLISIMIVIKPESSQAKNI